jgi:hypothetical protein
MFKLFINSILYINKFKHTKNKKTKNVKQSDVMRGGMRHHYT